MQDKMRKEAGGPLDSSELARFEALEQLLAQRALRQSEAPGLAARALGAIESRALARQFLSRRGAFARVLTPRERTTLQAVVAGTSREISGAAMALLHFLSAPDLRSWGAGLLGAACGYSFGFSLQGLAPAFASSLGPANLGLGHPALLLGLLGTLTGGLFAQSARVRAYLR